MEIPKRKIQISICSSSGMSHESFISYNHMMLACSRNTPHEYSLCYAYRSFIHFARKACVKQAIETEADYLLFLDDDMVWNPAMPARLLAIAEYKNLEIVSGYYTTRKETPFPLIYRRREDGMYSPILPTDKCKDALFECDATGFGAILLKTDVFRKIPEPWFELPDGMTEDVYFFNKCAEQGIKCYVDTGMACGHKGDFGWNFPYQCDLEKQVKGRIVHCDEAMHANEKLLLGEENGKGQTEKGPIVLSEQTHGDKPGGNHADHNGSADNRAEAGKQELCCAGVSNVHLE
jgi:hypothetical protein